MVSNWLKATPQTFIRTQIFYHIQIDCFHLISVFFFPNKIPFIFLELFLNEIYARREFSAKRSEFCVCFFGLFFFGPQDLFHALVSKKGCLFFSIRHLRHLHCGKLR